MDHDRAEALLSRTMEALGLDATLPPPPADTTITPQTLHALGRGVTQQREQAAGQGVISAGPLPRISVHDAAAKGRLRGRADGPDLELTGLLGRGGMGEVHVGRQRSLARDVAIKRPIAGASPATVEALCHEALVAGHLGHPNVVPIYALGQDDQQRPLVVMKQIEGRAWAALLAEDTARAGWPAAAGEALARHVEILKQVCRALEYAHSREIIHRDVKPDNVMVGRFGEVYLLDWALALRLGSPRGARAALLGTPAYMAPEMVCAGEIGVRTDVYLLGATLHEVLTGQPRHQGETLQQMLLSAMRSEPAAYPGEVPEELARLANRATAADPAQRPPTAAAFRRAIEDYERHRASLSLSRAADERLAAIERCEHGGAAGEDGDSAEEAVSLDRLVDEARFGYRQALQEWPDNPAARDGLQSCLEGVVRREIARRNPSAARAALAELPRPSAELEAAVEALTQQLAAERREQGQLRALARAHDPTPAQGLRLRLLGGYALLLLALGLFGTIIMRPRSGGPTVGVSLAIIIVVLLVTVVGVALARRRLLVNAFNRRLVAWFLALLAALLLHRLTGWIGGVSLSRMLISDLLILGMALAAGAILLFRWLWIGAGLAAGGSLVATVWPAIAPPVFYICVLATVLSALALALARGTGSRISPGSPDGPPR